MTRDTTILAIEGPDGIGKTTLTHNLVYMLRRRGRRVVCVRAPSVENNLREVIFMLGNENPRILTHLFFADFILSAERIIAPAIRRGEIIILDRFILSTAVYQYYRYRVEERDSHVMEIITSEKKALYATYGFCPHHVVLTGIPPATLTHRINLRGKQNIFEKDIRSVVRGYAEAVQSQMIASCTEIAMRNGHRIRSEHEVAEEVFEHFLA